MKSIRVHEFGGPEVLILEEIPVPVPGPGEVLVRVQAIGVNPVETYLRSGSNPALARPYTPGTDCAGTVEVVGEGVVLFGKGARIYTSATVTGAYAEFAVCRVADVHLLTKAITVEQGAGINIPYATAYRALKQRANAKSGESVLIHGASGGVGLAATQLARSLGLIVIGTAGTAEGRALVLENGAHQVFDHRADGYLDEVTAVTGGRGPDIILEMLSNVNLAKDISIIAKRGRIIVIGCRGKIEINPRDLMIREADVRGLLLFNCDAYELEAIHVNLFSGLENRSLRPVIGRRFPLADAAAAHAAVLEPGAHGKILLLP